LTLDQHIQRYFALESWFKTPQGQRVAQALTDEISFFVPQLRGERLLQLGHCGDNPWLSSMQYTSKMIISPYAKSGATMAGVFNQLPIDRDCIDCIIAPLTFEALSFDKNSMDELDRVLKPEGYMVFFGINPCSFWGMFLKLGCLNLFGKSQTRLTSFFSIKRVLLNQDYMQCALTTFYFIPPLNNERWIAHLEFLNEMGKMLWLFPANFYCLVVKKHKTISPTPLVDMESSAYLTYVDNSLA